ncbi:MAG: glycosyltransferase family 61 protein [Proteobacteria bacterium]|nr:glycosyltransferase family 61 protein [Pseudomonadota bacterium]
MINRRTSSQVLLPEVTIKRVLPSNYSQKISYLGKTKEIKLFDYGEASVDSNGVIFRGLRWMKETLSDHESSFYKKQKRLVKYLKAKLKVEKDPVLVVYDSFHVMYYHWLCDMMVRISLAKKIIKSNFKIVIPINYYKNNFCLSSLKMLGIEENQLIIIDKKEVVKSSQMFFVSCALGGSLINTTHDSAIIDLRDEMLNYCKLHNKLDFNLGKKIFISRSRQKKRIILNQKDVDQLLLRYGFAIVNMEDFNFEDGVAIVYNADYIVSQCGSNLTNIMFAREDTKVLELYPKKEYGDKNGGTWFSELSQACGLEHDYQHCEIDQNNFYINEFHTDMIVDLEELEKRLKLF